MAEELRYAIRCDGTKHKATLKRTCNGCSPITTYVPAPMHINHVTSQIVSHENECNKIVIIHSHVRLCVVNSLINTKL